MSVNILKNWMFYFLRFDGRISRSEFLIFSILCYIIIYALVFLTIPYIEKYQRTLGDGQPFQLMASAAVLMLLYTTSIVMGVWFGNALFFKRLHDRNKSAWWLLLNSVPFIGQIWILVECVFLRGTVGANRFGPDPLVSIVEVKS